MNEQNVKEPVILDLSGDIEEALGKLESIIYTSGWRNYLHIHPDTPTEDILLFSLIRERAIAVCEVYYTFVYDFTEELRNKAYHYFHRLRKRNMDSIYLNAVDHFSKYEPDIEKTDNGSLFYPEIGAYVRCGDLSPKKIFELMQTDGCERVIIFGSGLLYNKEQPFEIFHSFEMRAPKEYIMERLAKLREEQFQLMASFETRRENKIFNDIFPTVQNEE